MRVSCVVSILLLFAAAEVEAASKKRSKSQSKSRPPENLHRVGDHWTPYNPPDTASFPAGTRVHIIKRGDTLWDLAQTYYGNSYLWPQLWEGNTYITDAHWIYPGDPLQVRGEPTTGAVETTTVTDESGEMTEVASAGVPVALGTESDIYCWGYLGDRDEALPNRITAFEDVEVKYSRDATRHVIGVTDGDILYITGGAATGLVAGETYLVVKPAELVYHPRSKDLVGRHYDYRGRVRILCTSPDRATAVVVQSCKDIHIGDAIKPIPEHPIPLARLTPMPGVCDPSSMKSSGFIVNAKDFYHALGEGAIVEVNLGREAFVQPGDFMTVYRDSLVEGTPRQVLGEVAILTAEARTATGKITQMRYSMQVGDRVELK